mgnify:CR=1 FL=1
MNLPNLKELSCSELEEMAAAVEAEVKARSEARFNELCNTASRALNTLKMEYPWVYYDAKFVCPVCGETVEMNIFDMVNHFEVNRFCK